MNDSRLRMLAAAALLVGATLGMAGSFVSSASVRAVAWGIDGTALVVAAALLTMRYFRKGNDLAAAGFLVFVAGETLVVSGSAMELAASVPVFGAGTALWAVSLALIGASGVMPRWLSAIGYVAALLFTIVALRILQGDPLTPLTEPLPFFAYPFFAATLLGWAWIQYRGAEP